MRETRNFALQFTDQGLFVALVYWVKVEISGFSQVQTLTLSIFTTPKMVKERRQWGKLKPTGVKPKEATNLLLGFLSSWWLFFLMEFSFCTPTELDDPRSLPSLCSVTLILWFLMFARPYNTNLILKKSRNVKYMIKIKKDFRKV